MDSPVTQPAIPLRSSNGVEAATLESNDNRASPSTDGQSIDPRGSDVKAGTQPKKPKQTRNKPTLSCHACVTHKTKCDRSRPTCLACVKRATECVYSTATASNATDRKHRRRSRRASSLIENDNSPVTVTADGQPSKCSIASITHPTGDNAAESSYGLSTVYRRPSVLEQSLSSITYGPPGSRARPAFDSGRRVLSGFGNAGLLPSTDGTPMGLFGMGGEHPFANYWTCKGGLAEVVSVLPSKSQADILVAKYFEIVDSQCPILDRVSFMKEYEHFWSLDFNAQCKYEAAAVSLHFVIYATATQYIELPSPSERTKTAEFYISAGHQAIRISSYLNRISITTVQTMILFFFFLINDNHISDAWTFSGITQRQAYILQLNREPDTVVPRASVAEKNLRCRLWSMIIFQESSIALSLRLPSTSLQCDVGPHSLSYDESVMADHFDPLLDTNSAALHPDLTKSDISYCKSIWAYAVFVQENICRPRALGLPICQSNEHKREMLSAFRSLYRSFPGPFGSYDPQRFFDPSRRVARQQISLTQSFFHALMLMCADENMQADVITDAHGTFEAAHESMGAFFAMNALFGDETNGWWAYQHKAFEQAMLVAKLLASDTKPLCPPALNGSLSREYSMLLSAKEDVKRLLAIMSSNRGGFFEFQSIQERRFDTLQTLYDTINVV